MVERQHRARADAGGQRCHHDVHERACAAPPRRLLAVSELTGRVASAWRWRPRTLAGLPVPGLAVSGLPVPGLAVPWLAVPRLPVPGLPVPRLAVPGLAVPWLAVSGLLRLGGSGLAVPGLAVCGLLRLGGSGLLRLAVTTGAVRAGGNAGRQGRNPRASLDRWRRPGIRARRLLAALGGHHPRVLGRRYCRTLLGGARSRARDGTLRAPGGTFRAPGRTFRVRGGACPRVRGRTCPRVRGRTGPCARAQRDFRRVLGGHVLPVRKR